MRRPRPGAWGDKSRGRLPGCSSTNPSHQQNLGDEREKIPGGEQGQAAQDPDSIVFVEVRELGRNGALLRSEQCPGKSAEPLRRGTWRGQHAPEGQERSQKLQGTSGNA